MGILLSVIGIVAAAYFGKKKFDDYKRSKAEMQAQAGLADYLTSSLNDPASLPDTDTVRSKIESYGLDVFSQRQVTGPFLRDLFEKYAGDKVLSDDEFSHLSKLMKSFGSEDPSAYGIKTLEWNGAKALGALSKGIFPKVTNASELGVVLKKAEDVHWVVAAGTLKQQKTRVSVRYQGFNASIRIMKGLTYRTGVIRGIPTYELKTVLSDTGYIWISNQRIGFKGSATAWTMPIAKVLSAEMSDGTLQLFKEGREKPYWLALDEYSVFLAILGKLIEVAHSDGDEPESEAA